jgi:hypothetical protein
LSFPQVRFLDLVRTSWKVLLLLSLISSKISISQSLLSFPGNSSNSDPKILEKNSFSPSQRVPLLSSFDFFMESLRLFVEFQTCALFATDLYTDLSSCDNYALLAAVTLHSLLRKSYAISPELYKSKQTLSTHSLRTVCTPCTSSQKKAILKFIQAFQSYMHS